MNKTGDNMEKRIRSVKTWLDKAEQAYADDSATKGQLQLMLAKSSKCTTDNTDIGATGTIGF